MSNILQKPCTTSLESFINGFQWLKLHSVNVKKQGHRYQTNLPDIVAT
jgi:hypothetical protein